MGEMNNNGNDQDNLELPKEHDHFESADEGNTVPLPSYTKKSNKNIIAIVIVAVLLVGAAAGFLFKGYLSNQLMLLMKSPAQYYSYVEQKSIKSGIDSFTKTYAAAIDQNKNKNNGLGSNMTAELSISPEFAGLYGLSDIGTLKLDANVFYTGLKEKIATEIFYNNKSLAHLNVLYNIEDELYYLQVPELSNAYLMSSMADLMSQNGVYLDSDYTSNVAQIQKVLYDGTLTPEKLNQLLTKYTGIIIDGFKTVEQNDNTTLSISDTSGKYTSLNVQINAKDLYEILYNILNTAKNDKDLKELLVKSGVTTDAEYVSDIEYAIQSLDENKASVENDTSYVNMTVFVDDSGAIIGREFSVSDSSSVYGYYGIRKGSNIDFTAYIKQDDVSLADITGSAVYADGKLSGSADITFDDGYSFTGKLEFKDLKVSDDSKYFNGSMTLTSDNFNGISLGLDLVGNSDSQQMNLKMLYGNLDGITLNITTKEIPYSDIELPSGSDAVYNVNSDFYGYIGNMDIEGFFDHIYDVTGLDLTSLLYGLGGY